MNLREIIGDDGENEENKNINKITIKCQKINKDITILILKKKPKMLCPYLNKEKECLEDYESCGIYLSLTAEEEDDDE